jgi:hypothetical protein
LKLNFTVLFAFVVVAMTSRNASAFLLSTWKTVDGPPKQYCVSPGLMGNAPYKCVPWDEAKKVGFDNETVYGGTSGPTLAQYTLAQSEMDRTTKDYDYQQRTLDTLQEKLRATNERIRTERFTEAELNSMKQLKLDLENSIQSTNGKLKLARTALEEAKANPISGGVLDANALKIEIARKGLLIQVTDLENKMGTLEDNLNATEAELNNSVLEAFVVSKLNKLSANFCSASAMCAKDPAAVKDWLSDKFTSEKLKKSFKKSTPAAPATAPANR